MPLSLMAHGNGKLDIEKYRDELRDVVMAKADFTEEEADVFFVLYFELRDKEREIFSKGAKVYKGKYMTEEESYDALMYYDDSLIQLKQMQKDYHKLMLEHIPAQKLLIALRRCEKFSREVYQRISSQQNNCGEDCDKQQTSVKNQNK